MAKVKNKRNADLADRVQKKKKVDANKKKLNPFEVHINREKIKVLGKKSKHDRGLPGVSRAKAIQKRKETLGTEMKLMNKTNAFIDRRIGEKNTQLSAEDRMIARFAAERAKQHNRKSMYNLADDEILTHRGQTLEQIEKFDDPRSSDDEDEVKKFGGLGDDFVSEGHFGGGILSKSDTKDGAKSHKDLIEQLIAESKKRKAEKQKEKEQTLDLTEKLDSEWKDLQPVVFKRQKVEEESLIDKLLSKEEKGLDYDRMMRELRFEKRGTPSDGLKSQEKLEAEEKKKIEEMEKQRLERMYPEGEASWRTVQPTTKHRSADDLDDNFELDNAQDFMLAYDKDGKPLVPEHILKDYSVPNAKKKFEDGVSDTSEEEDSEVESDDEDDGDEENDDVNDTGSAKENDDNSRNKPEKILNKIERIELNNNATSTPSESQCVSAKSSKNLYKDDFDKKFAVLKTVLGDDLIEDNKDVDVESSESSESEDGNSNDEANKAETNPKQTKPKKVKSDEKLVIINSSKNSDQNSETNIDKNIKNIGFEDKKGTKTSNLGKRQKFDNNLSESLESDSGSIKLNTNNIDGPILKKAKLNQELDKDSESSDTSSDTNSVKPILGDINYVNDLLGDKINNPRHEKMGSDEVNGNVSDDDVSESDSDCKINSKIDELLSKANYEAKKLKSNKEIDEDSEFCDSDTDINVKGQMDVEEHVGSFFDIAADGNFNLNELLSGKSPTQQSNIISGLIKKYDPSLAENNKEMLSNIYAHLLQYVNDIFTNLNNEGEIIKSFLIFDKLVPHFYDLAHINKVSSKKYIVELLKEKHEDFKKNPKIVPDLDTLIFFKLISILYPTSDFRHPVTTPSLIFMTEILTHCKFKDAYSLSRGLFIVSLILEYTFLSKRYEPSAVNYLRGIFYLCANTSILNPIQLVPPFKLHTDVKILNLECDCSNLKLEHKMAVKDLTAKKIDDDFKIRVLATSVLMLKEFFDKYNDFEALKAIFDPHIQILGRVDLEIYPKTVRKLVSGILQHIRETLEVKTYTLMTREKVKPKALRMYEPDIQDVFTGSKSSKLSRENAERSRLQAKYKREMKGALREVRRDKAYIASVKIKQKIQGDKIRKEKVKQIYKDASIQQGELNKLKRTK